MKIVSGVHKLGNSTVIVFGETKDELVVYKKLGDRHLCMIQKALFMSTQLQELPRDIFLKVLH